MRKIEQQIYDAIRHHKNLNTVNTKVTFELDGFKVYLHDNLIAWLKDNKLTLTSCGWDTRLTTSRLNVILQALGLDIHVRVRGFTTEYVKDNKVLATKRIELNYFK